MNGKMWRRIQVVLNEDEVIAGKCSQAKLKIKAFDCVSYNRRTKCKQRDVTDMSNRMEQTYTNKEGWFTLE